jgi:hypothetical protein
MNTIMKYRGQMISSDDIDFINRLIAENPDDSRNALSIKLCKEWNWVQTNGALRDMVARGMMLELHRNDHITLPAKRRHPHNPLKTRKAPDKIDIDQTLIKTAIKNIRPLTFTQVRRTPSEKIFNSLIEQFHYLGYTQPVGEHLKYLVSYKDRPVACLAWSSAPRHIGERDKFIGWNAEVRMNNLHSLAYNTRFLILPWIKVPHLASHILGTSAQRISNDWENVYNHPIHYLETFVDTERFKGTCYKASNWIYIGDTKGLGKDAKNKKPNRSIKAIFGYPLSRNFRKLMGGLPG